MVTTRSQTRKANAASQPFPPQEEAPATKAPSTIVVNTKVTKTKVTKTKVPTTKVTKTKAPKTKVPKTKAPKTKAPKTKAPKTEAPTTKAPKTKAPNTKANTSSQTSSRVAQSKTTLTKNTNRVTKRTTSPARSRTPSNSRRRYSFRRPQKYFWYRSLSKNLRLAGVPKPKTRNTSTTDTNKNTDTPNKPNPAPITPPPRAFSLQQVNDYTFSPRLFTALPPPKTFPPTSIWPPANPLDIMLAIGPEPGECVDSTCYTNKRCRDRKCTHTFSQWRAASGDNWEDYFELRETPDGRGVGVYTRTSFRKDAVLGWYSGTIVPFNHQGNLESDYLMDFAIGDSKGYIYNQVFQPTTTTSTSSSQNKDKKKKKKKTKKDDSDDDDEPEPEDIVWVDAARRGNWTRFINHSCDPYSFFEPMRVGGTRLMCVVARREIPSGVELTVDYGEDYWRFRRRACRCGVVGCYGAGDWGDGGYADDEGDMEGVEVEAGGEVEQGTKTKKKKKAAKKEKGKAKSGGGEKKLKPKLKAKPDANKVSKRKTETARAKAREKKRKESIVRALERVFEIVYW